MDTPRTSPTPDGADRDPLAALRSADPARALEVSESFVERVLARAATEGAEGAGPGIEPTGVQPSVLDGVAASAAEEPAVLGLAPVLGAEAGKAPTIDLEAAREARARRRARSQRRWFPAVAAAAALAVGVVGWGVGVGSRSGTLGATPTAGFVSLETSPGAAGLGVSGADSAATGVAGGAESALGQEEAAAPMVGTASEGSAASAVSDAMVYPGMWRTVFTGSGWGTQGGTSTGYGLDARLATTPERVAQVATALGLTEPPTLAEGSWQVGPMDGSSPSMSVSLDGAASVWFTDPAFDPWSACYDWNDAPEDEGATEEEWRAFEERAQACLAERAASLPSADDAMHRLYALIAAFGLDPDSYAYSVPEDTNSYPSPGSETSVVTTAVATRVVDGQASPQSISIDLAPGGELYSMWGTLAQPVALGEYPIVGEAEAFARLGDPRFGPQNVVWPVDVAVAYEPEPYVAPTQAPALPTAPTPISWPVTSVELVSVRLGLAQQWQPDGAVLIVPAYEFTSSEGGIYSVIALADSALDFTAP